MELCDLTLEDRIKEMGLNSVEGVPDQKIPARDDFVGAKNSASQLRDAAINIGPTVDHDHPDQALGIPGDGFIGLPTPPESSSDPPPADNELNWEPVMEILDDMTSGLIYIHGKNIVHRDLKPRNGI
jgi:hypothetical protein